MHDGGSEARCVQVPRTVLFRTRMHGGGSEARRVQVPRTVVFRIRMHDGGSEARCVRVPRTVLFRIRMHGRGSDIAVRRRRAQCSLLAPRSDRGRCGGCPAPRRGEAALPVVQRPSHPGSVCARGGWLGGGMTGHPARRVRQARRRVRVRDARSQIGGTRG